MAHLRWSGNDGFDSAGRRVASVVRTFEVGTFGSVQGAGHGPAFAAPRRYWEAFVAFDGTFDRVTVDGRPGTWLRRDEAVAAAESAHEAWAAALPREPAGVADEDGAPRDREEVLHGNGSATGVLTNLRDLVRAWRSVYRRDGQGPT